MHCHQRDLGGTSVSTLHGLHTHNPYSPTPHLHKQTTHCCRRWDDLLSTASSFGFTFPLFSLFSSSFFLATFLHQKLSYDTSSFSRFPVCQLHVTCRSSISFILHAVHIQIQTEAHLKQQVAQIVPPLRTFTSAGPATTLLHINILSLTVVPPPQDGACSVW